MTGTFATSVLLILEIVMRRGIFLPVPADAPGDIVLGAGGGFVLGVFFEEVFDAELFVIGVVVRHGDTER
jgi:hypothetical protein